MTRAEYIEFHAKFCEQMQAITAKKNADYSGGAGDSPFANFEQIGNLVAIPNVVEIGFLTRMSDKMSRIGSFIVKGELQVKDESVIDSLMDLANYAALFAGYLKADLQKRKGWDRVVETEQMGELKGEVRIPKQPYQPLTFEKE